MANKKRKSLTPKAIVAQEKRRQALELRKAGATYMQIARAVGYSSPSSARRAMVTALSEIVQEPVQELRTIQKERLNHMLMILWPQIQGGDRGAIMTALSIMDKMDRYDPVEVPAQHSVSVVQENAILVIDGNKDDYIAQIKKMIGVNADGTNKEIKAAPSVYGTPEPLAEEDVVEAELVEQIPPAPVSNKKKDKDWDWTMGGI